MPGIPMTALDLTDYPEALAAPRPVYPQSGTARRMSALLSDQDPREYGTRAPDGTSWIHVPWQGWQRNDGHPFLERAGYEKG